MKKAILTVFAVSVLMIATFGFVLADKPTAVDSHGNEIAWQNTGCTTIQSGTLNASDGSTIDTGYDQWGYNYQAHMFNGYYDNYNRPAVPVTEGDKLQMKWNDAWLSNVDCEDSDSLLDRHYGFTSYIDSGAWLTNHAWGTNEDGSTWEDFVKIIAVPSSAHTEDAPLDCPTDWGLDGKMWYNEDGTELGCSIWGQFALTQEVYNDHTSGYHGILTNMQPAGLGLA